MFGLFSVPWDFFHIGLLIVVIMIMITGMVICVSVIGVCCFHWLDNLESGSEQNNNESGQTDMSNMCQYDTQNQSVHVVVLPEKMKGGQSLDPCQLRDHFQRLELELSHRRFLYQEQGPTTQLSFSTTAVSDDGLPPAYEQLFPSPPQPPPPPGTK